MRIIIRQEVSQEDAVGVFTYLLRKNFMMNGRTAIGRTSGEIGKFLLHPENRDFIKDIRFDNEKYIIKLPSDHPTLSLEHHTDDEGNVVTNEEFYPITYALKEDYVYVTVQDKTWRELQGVVVFNEESSNVFANEKAKTELENTTKVDEVYLDGLLKDELYDILLRLEKKIGEESGLDSNDKKADIKQWIIDTLGLAEEINI